MIYNILDANLEQIGDIDEAISKIWDKHYMASSFSSFSASSYSFSVSTSKSLSQ